MRRYAEACGRVAQLAKPIAETGCGVRLAEMRHQKCFDADRRRALDDFAQLGMHRDLKVRLVAAIGLALINDEKIAYNMLATKLDHIATPLPGIEQQGEGKPRFSADGMCRLKPRDLGFRPCPVSGSLHLLAVNAERRIVGDAAFVARPSKH